MEDLTDAAFVRQWVVSDLWCTPLYYRAALRRWPERHVAAIAAVARAGPGGVLIHCVRGNDRTGIVTMLLLALVGVAPDDIVADFELSPDPRREELLAREHTSARDAIFATLAWLDVDGYLRASGLSEVDLAAVRTRLLEPMGTVGDSIASPLRARFRPPEQLLAHLAARLPAAINLFAFPC